MLARARERLGGLGPVLVAALLLLVLSGAGVGLAIWGADKLDDKAAAAAGIAGLVLVGVGLVVVLLAAVSRVYTTSTGAQQDAFGLPDGSIRALLALAVLFAFVAVVIYILSVVLDGADAAQRAAAQQVIGVLGTLLAAVAAFYFGTNSVKTGAAAIASLAAATPELKPEAITKGTNSTSQNEIELVGLVHPHGRRTRYFFEYTRERSPTAPSTYPEQTPVGTVDPADEPVEVRVPLDTPLPDGSWMRLVAFNEVGTSFGRDQQVGGA
jgi:hypothetical protein